MSFPDVEADLVALLGPYGMVTDPETGTLVAGAATTIGTDLQDVTASGAHYVVVHAGGGEQNHFQWKPNVQVMTFGADRGALATAEDICEYLTTQVSRHHPFDRITVQSSPQETPWAGDSVRLWTATYQAVVRRR